MTIMIIVQTVDRKLTEKYFTRKKVEQVIDGKKLIEDVKAEIQCVEKEKQRYFESGNFHNGNILVERMQAMKLVMKIIANQPQIEKCADCSRRKFYQQGYQDGLNADKWIPCEERLPKEEGNYCVTRENGEVDIDCFLIWANNDGSFNNCIDDNPIRFPEKKVIAWQPLPQPYKKEGAE